MHCPSCGYPIDQQNLERCPRCGYALTPTTASSYGQGGDGYLPRSDDPGSTGGYVPPQPPENPYSGYGSAAPPSGYGPPQQQDPAVPYGQYGQYGQQGQYGQPAPPSGYGQPAYGQPAPPSGYGQPTPPSGYGQPAPPSGYGQQPYGAYAPSSYPLAPGYPQPRPPLAPLPERKSRVGLIIGVVAAVVVVLAVCTCGTIFAVQSLSHSAVIRGFPTITVYTPTPAPTPTTIPARTVIYQNTFASGADGWSTDTSTCFWKSDGYHVTDGYECYAPTGVQKNVDISVRAKQLSGDTRSPYGLVFGLDNKNSDYQFVIVGDSSWALFRCTNDGCTAAVDYTDDPAILGGLRTSNRLEVLVQGTHFEFYVNGTQVGSYDDPNYTSGRVGVAVGDKVECAFTDFVVSRP